MASGIDISIRSDIKALTRTLDNFAYKQVPYATALALNGIANAVKVSETAALSTALHKKPTPFTQHAFAVISAKKATLTAVVFAKDAQAQYLAPSEVGGNQILGNSQRIRTPVDQPINAYGNLPKGKIAQLLKNPNNFMGVVKGINGIWQRASVKHKRSRPVKGHLNPVSSFSSPLKLLVAFTKPVTIDAHLGYEKRAAQIVQTNINPEFSKAMAKAISTAKP